LSFLLLGMYTCWQNVSQAGMPARLSADGVQLTFTFGCLQRWTSRLSVSCMGACSSTAPASSASRTAGS
jgi:hypothetical protein